MTTLTSPADFESRLNRLFDLLERVNQKVNLTAIRDRKLMAIQHGEDSLSLARLLPDLFLAARTLVDLGTGAGFPLLPLAILRPELECWGVDSVAKKLRFVAEAASELGLSRVHTDGRRAEMVGRDPAHREKHDLVTSRAVGSVSSLLEVSLPLCRVGGHAIMYKTEPAVAELKALGEVVDELGGEILPAPKYRLEGDRQRRVLLVIRKFRPTPEKFPRATGIPFNKPLAPVTLQKS
jgi:16S rRNA (guanine527-N7)-methyltransferase